MTVSIFTYINNISRTGVEGMAGTPKLIILSEQFRGRTFDLEKEMITVGRVDERDICIKDPTVSTLHCTLTLNEDGSLTVEDHNSTNGTRINNVPVQGTEILHNTDVLQIGGIELLFDSDDKSVTAFMKTTTDIDVSIGRTQTIDRMDSGFTRKRKSDKSNKLLLIIIILLGLVVIALLAAVIVIAVAGGKGQEAAGVIAPFLIQ